MDFKNYLKMIGKRATPWAIENGISPAVISRRLNGGGISPANAAKIVKATKGAVTFDDIYKPEKDAAA